MSKVRAPIMLFRKLFKIHPRAVVIACGLLVIGTVYGGVLVAGTTTVDRGGLTSGGSATASSPTLRVAGVLGQIAITRAQSNDRIVDAGLWSTMACDCRYHGDIDADGDIDVFDVILIVDVAFRNGPNPPADPYCHHFNRADVNCDGQIDVFDAIIEVAASFQNDDRRCRPCGN